MSAINEEDKTLDKMIFHSNHRVRVNTDPPIYICNKFILCSDSLKTLSDIYMNDSTAKYDPYGNKLFLELPHDNVPGCIWRLMSSVISGEYHTCLHEEKCIIKYNNVDNYLYIMIKYGLPDCYTRDLFQHEDYLIYRTWKFPRISKMESNILIDTMVNILFEKFSDYNRKKHRKTYMNSLKTKSQWLYGRFATLIVDKYVSTDADAEEDTDYDDNSYP